VSSVGSFRGTVYQGAAPFEVPRKQRGVEWLPSGEMYGGDFDEEGKRCCENGLLIKEGGDVVQGNFKDGLPNGDCHDYTRTARRPRMVEIMMVQGKKHGRGIESTSNCNQIYEVR
jgi:hypothetical protein